MQHRLISHILINFLILYVQIFKSLDFNDLVCAEQQIFEFLRVKDLEGAEA